MGLPDTVRECARDVNDELGSGLRENAYHKALAVALSDEGVQFTTEGTIPVLYRGMPVARMHPDLIVGNGSADGFTDSGERSEPKNDERYILELKANRDGTQQLKSYLDYAEANDMDDIEGGLMLSFGPQLDVKQL